MCSEQGRFFSFSSIHILKKALSNQVWSNWDPVPPVSTENQFLAWKTSSRLAPGQKEQLKDEFDEKTETTQNSFSTKFGGEKKKNHTIQKIVSKFLLHFANSQLKEWHSYYWWSTPCWPGVGVYSFGYNSRERAWLYDNTWRTNNYRHCWRYLGHQSLRALYRQSCQRDQGWKEDRLAERT